MHYLHDNKKNLQWDKLLALKEERRSWWDRESALRWKVDYPSYRVDNIDFSTAQIKIEGIPTAQDSQEKLREMAQKLIPWKKGPFQLFELQIEAQWRSDMKWDRLAPHLPNLKDKMILDIGCNNGYFLFRMASHKPHLALGIDPVLPMQAQFNLIQHYAQIDNLHFELFGVEHLPLFSKIFDVIFHMGIIYHHRHPIQQLLDIREALVPGGIVFLETIGIPGKESHALFPEDRYACMKNIWFIPTLSCFINWAKKAKFTNIEVLSDTLLTNEEQRKTPWCPFPGQSLESALDPHDPRKTKEGHPAPRRFLIKAQKNKKGGSS